MSATLSFVTLLLLLVTLLPLWRHPHWTVRGMDFPRLQFTVVAGILLLAQLTFLNPAEAAAWALIVPTVLCLAWQAWWILPYTPLWPPEVRSADDHGHDRRLSVMTANVVPPLAAGPSLPQPPLHRALRPAPAPDRIRPLSAAHGARVHTAAGCGPGGTGSRRLRPIVGEIPRRGAGRQRGGRSRSR